MIRKCKIVRPEGVTITINNPQTREREQYICKPGEVELEVEDGNMWVISKGKRVLTDDMPGAYLEMGWIEFIE